MDRCAMFVDAGYAAYEVYRECARRGWMALIGDKRVIRSGVTKDETVLINGLAKVRPGMPVTPMPPEKKVAEAPAK